VTRLERNCRESNKEEEREKSKIEEEGKEKKRIDNK